MRILLIDNYDSFTYNVADLLARLGAHVDVIRNDAQSVEQLLAAGHDAIVLSPGPGRPDAAGVSVEMVHAAIAGRVPLLGICLGMQSIGRALGGRITRLAGVVHGAASAVEHDGVGVFEGMPQRFEAGRYHSLVVESDPLPAGLVATAHTVDGVLMGVRHQHAPVEGVQFHPESVLTPSGIDLLGNFLDQSAALRGIAFRSTRTMEVA